MLKLYFVFLISIFSHFAMSASGWPSEDDIKFVEGRLNKFPWQSIVSDVDWYSPLEVVKGSATSPLVVDLINSEDYSKAQALAEQKNSYALLIWQNGALRFEKYWPGFDKESRYDTASMHKTVLATLLGISWDQGLFENVDTPLSNYLPEFKNKKVGQVTIRSLLEMSSGITSPPFSRDPSGVSLQTYLGNNLKKAISHWQVVGEPGEEFSYSNANPQYLSWMIERLSGQRYADYLSEHLWQAIGASDARVWLDHEGGSARTSCCLHANARDWLKFGLLILNQGKVGDKQVVSAAWLEQMTAASEQNPNYGWQIWRGSPHNPARTYNKSAAIVVPAKEAFNADDTIYLDGSGAQRVYIIPSANTVIVRIGQPSRDWDDSQLPNLIVY